MIVSESIQKWLEQKRKGEIRGNAVYCALCGKMLANPRDATKGFKSEFMKHMLFCDVRCRSGFLFAMIQKGRRYDVVA